MKDQYTKKLQSTPKAMKQKAVKDSVDWFKQAVDEEDERKVRSELKSKEFLKHSSIVPGQLYFFGYDAKGKDKLPYWDAFPLIFPINDIGSHFIGLNLHYAQPQARAMLFDEIIESSGGNPVRAHQIITAASSLGLFEQCIKKYLKSHTTSKFILVPQESWQYAMNLPVADWRNPTFGTKRSRRR